MHPSRLRQAALLLALSLATITVAPGCATSRAKVATKKQHAKAKAKDVKPGSYDIYRNRDIDWKILKLGQDEMGTAALDSY